MAFPVGKRGEAHRGDAADLNAALEHDEAGDLAAADAVERDAQALSQRRRNGDVEHPESVGGKLRILI